MSRSSDRAQVDPIAALVAVAALGIGLSLYAGAVSDALRDPREPRTEQVLETIHDRLAPNGVIQHSRLAQAATRPGLQVNATLRTRTRRWSTGPAPPDGAADASRRVSVSLGPTRVRPGQLRVVVW